MKRLTARQREILDYITASIEERGYPPTIREIGKKMGIRSTNGVNDHLKALERKGYLRRDDLKSRAMRPVLPDAPEPAANSDDIDIVEIPLLAWVASDQQIGKRIRDTRTAANLSQRQLADALGEHGLTITREAISLIESGQRRVSGKEVAGMATVLGTSTDHLLCHDRALPTLAFFP